MSYTSCINICVTIWRWHPYARLMLPWTPFLELVSFGTGWCFFWDEKMRYALVQMTEARWSAITRVLSGPIFMGEAFRDNISHELNFVETIRCRRHIDLLIEDYFTPLTYCALSPRIWVSASNLSKVRFYPCVMWPCTTPEHHTNVGMSAAPWSRLVVSLFSASTEDRSLGRVDCVSPIGLCSNLDQEGSLLCVACTTRVVQLHEIQQQQQKVMGEGTLGATSSRSFAVWPCVATNAA